VNYRTVIANTASLKMIWNEKGSLVLAMLESHPSQAISVECFCSEKFVIYSVLSPTKLFKRIMVTLDLQMVM
jgi:hypothetical protein